MIILILFLLIKNRKHLYNFSCTLPYLLKISSELNDFKDYKFQFEYRFIENTDLNFPCIKVKFNDFTNLLFKQTEIGLYFHFIDDKKILFLPFNSRIIQYSGKLFSDCTFVHIKNSMEIFKKLTSFMDLNWYYDTKDSKAYFNFENMDDFRRFLIFFSNLDLDYDFEIVVGKDILSL